jgi:polysaccharide export outer membrane protein
MSAMTFVSITRRRRSLLLCLALTAAPAALARAQDPIPPVPAPMAGPRAQASREELQKRLVEIERIIGSSGYSSRIKDTRKRERDLIQRRLAEGDIGVGDQINLMVINEPTLTGNFMVGPGRVLSLPGVGEIPMGGVLRSEVEGYLTKELGKYVRNPSVRSQAMIRLTIVGDIGKPGYFQMPADLLFSDALMAAGGPGSGQRLDITVRRAGKQIMTKEETTDAIRLGMTLDQLNLQAGDELEANGRRTTFNFGTILAAVGAVVGIFYMVRNF